MPQSRPIVSAADDPIWGNFGATRETRVAPLVFSPAKLPDPSEIAPRQWLLGTQFLRGFVTVLVAPGGTGKSIYAMTCALSLATGADLLGMKVWQRVNVAVLNEDPIEELDRRLAAIMIRHKVHEEHVAGRYFLNSMDERGVAMGEVGPDGFTVVHPDEEQLIAQIRENEIGLLCVDPFAESHDLEENSNPQMIKAAAAWRRIARATNAAILLVHHVRKGAGEGGIDSARGAKGLTDSARVGLLMLSMTTEEAEKLGVPVEDRHQYVRLDNAKVNLSKRIDKADWFKLDEVPLGNRSEIYPNGDRVAAIVPWQAPKLFAKLTAEQINQTLDVIAEGCAPSILYSGTRKGGAERWAGDVVLRFCDVTEKQAQTILDTWVRSGLLFMEQFRHPETRKIHPGLRVDNSKRPS